MASSEQTSFLLSAADVSFGKRECNTVELDTGDFAAGEYFTMEVPTSNFGSLTQFYIWADDGVASDPAPAGLTGIAVDISGASDEADKAAAIVTDVDANANFQASLDSADSTNQTVILEAFYKGAVTNAAADVDSDVTITRQVTGGGSDFGKTSGGAEVSFETTSVIINSDQRGSIAEDEVLTGQTVEVTTTFIETTPARVKSLLNGIVGDSYTPTGGSEVTGFGDNSLYRSLKTVGGELVLHPTRLAASDRSKDITIPLCAPKPGSFTFSGEEVSGFEVTFTGLVKDDFASEINLLIFGDSQQDFR